MKINEVFLLPHPVLWELVLCPMSQEVHLVTALEPSLNVPVGQTEDKNVNEKRRK